MGIHKLTLIAFASLLCLPIWQKFVLRAAQTTHWQILAEEEHCAAELQVCDRDKIRNLGERGLIITDIFYISTVAVYALFLFWVYIIYTDSRKVVRAGDREDRA